LFHVAGVWATFISAVSARLAVLLAPSEIAGFHAWVHSLVAVKAVGAFIFALFVAVFSVHTISAAVAVLIAPTFITGIPTDSNGDHVVVIGMLAMVAHSTVHAVVMTPGFGLFIAVTIHAW
jgi:hypothetical protein